MRRRRMNALENLARRFKDASPRERAGLAFVTALVALALASSSFDWAMRARVAAGEAAHERAQVAAVQEHIGLANFQEEVALAAGKVWRSSVVDASEPLARVQATTSLESLAAGAGLANVSVEAAAAGEETPLASVGVIGLTLRADFSWAGYLAFLRALEASDLSFVVDSVEVSGDLGSGKTLVIVAHVPFIHENPS